MMTTNNTPSHCCDKPALCRLRFLLASAMLLLGVVSAGAQSMVRDMTEPPTYDSSRPARLVEIKPHLAVGISSLLQNYADALPGLSDIQLSPGAVTRVGVDILFGLRNSFYIGTGISYDHNNSKYAMSIVDNDLGTINSLYVSNRYRCITVPVYMSWRFNLGRRMRWNVDLGLYIAYGTGGRMKSSGYTSGINSIGQPVITHLNYVTRYFDDSQSIINGVKRFDYGPRIATGLIYRRHYSLNMIFELSTPNLAINHNVLDVRYRNVTVAFEIGYAF